ncbi:MAG: class I SAM-dependent methyltransferase [Saprospiraceae bacterium]|nr:class I SAM-dependent methyltransferase [Saprospiraceae bacterium]
MNDEKQGQVRRCRFCKTGLTQSVVDLGVSPLCQRHVTPQLLNEAEIFYPLHAFVCNLCWLMQLEEFASPSQIFAEEYAYFSSYSDSWVEHARIYAADMTSRFSLNAASQVVEIASNDGYLLQWFVQRGIPVLGIDPAANVAEAARAREVPTEVAFFGLDVAKKLTSQYGKADLMTGNNVLAHVPDINDFVAGIPVMLSENGVVTMEFPHLQRLIEENQFDTIYHEHFSYLSFTAVDSIFRHHGLTMFDVEELPTHGGSLRIFACRSNSTYHPREERVNVLLQREKELGMQTADYYDVFQEQVKETKRKLLAFLINAKQQGKSIVGYGAPGKGNTLLNYCGIRTDFLDYTVDRNPHKQGNYLPGTRIPIYHPDRIQETRPDYVLILPWNLRKEICEQMSHVYEWGGQFIVPIPEVKVLNGAVLDN